MAKELRICKRTGKHRHASQGGALAHLRGLQKREPDYNGEPYFCKFCGSWHIGRRKATAAMRARLKRAMAEAPQY